MDMNSGFVLSQRDARPMYLQIVEQVKQKVGVGDWVPGQKIPSIRSLAVELKISVITVKRAYLELEREGVILTRQGKESVIANQPDLGGNLLRQELSQVLFRAVEIAAMLHFGADQLHQTLDDVLIEQKEENS